MKAFKLLFVLVVVLCTKVQSLTVLFFVKFDFLLHHLK
jgi:hypothetical protein